MKGKRILITSVVVLAGVGLTWNQLRLSRLLKELRAIPPTGLTNTGAENLESAEAKLKEAEARYSEAEVQLDMAQQKIATANARLAQLETRLSQLEGGRRTRTTLRPAEPIADLPDMAEPTSLTNAVKRAWGPEQVAGAPDTFEAGDISTAWASREQDAGEEWLKLDYDNAVDIAEVRVRETYNPGAISKIAALLANGNEVVLWEGIEPQATAPVEMSFQVPSGVNARTVKVYLDTARVPGWNEIDAVELIGRDGSHQWAKQASASSTYAEPRVARGRGLEQF